ncbi:unnamed protein product [Lactuca saligna]|uniref:Uncharacterized protein n=1 Tax=Lactuca saligna TaxID=75948 RepID=A0AA35YE19_LACSI|nr:unnamed protein product [Lactuca saligna]
MLIYDHHHTSHYTITISNAHRTTTTVPLSPYEKTLICMCLQVNHGVNGLLFPKENIKALTQITLQVVSKGKLSSLATNIASTGEDTAKNMMALDSIEGYASLIENILHLPSEVASPREISEIPSDIKTKWQWHLFEAIEDREYIMKARRAREDDEVRDKSEQPRGTWEEVYKNAKKTDRNKNDLHERDDGDLKRTGQPLCIYEPYFGQRSWSFLHTNSLNRGIRLSTKSGRPRRDDIDAASRLPLLESQAVSKFCAKYLHQQVLKQEAYVAGDIGTAAQKSFLRMDEMMCGQRGWRELAILGNKMDQFSGMIEGLIWSPKGNDLKCLNDNWSNEEVSWTCSSERFLHNLLFLVCNINNNNFFSWAKEIMTHAKEYKMMTCLPSLSQKEILVKDFLVLLIEDKELVENPMIDAWLLKNRKSPWVGKKEGLQGCWIFY